MIHNEYAWKGTDGIMLYGQSWMPEKHPDVIINYVHGFKDHSARFEKWALRLVENGIGVIAIDLRGHGRSKGRRGYAPHFESYLDDIQILRLNANALFGTSIHILYGHSLGGSLVTNYLITRNLLPFAAVIASPWFTLAERQPVFKLFLGKVVRFLLPGLLVKSNLPAQYLSHNSTVVGEYLNDPLVHNRILPRLFFEIGENGLWASRSIYKINVPLLVMHGDADRITSCRQTRSFVMNAGKLTTYKEWPDGFHELHNDTGEQKVFDFLLQWMNKITRRT